MRPVNPLPARLVRPAGMLGWDQLVLPERDVRVWLPPGYDQSPRRNYPTLYVHDGQSATGEHSWELDSALSRLVATGSIEPAVVILIDSCVGHFGDIDIAPNFPLIRRRWIEYSDNPLGASFLNFVADQLKPAIDREFRTLPCPRHTHVMGSSMGGLLAFRSVWRRPDVFGAAACLSPVFQQPLIAEVYADVAAHAVSAIAGGEASTRASELRRARRRAMRVYIDNGGDTAERRVPVLDVADGWDPGYWWLDTNLQPGVDQMCARAPPRAERVNETIARDTSYPDRRIGDSCDTIVRFKSAVTSAERCARAASASSTAASRARDTTRARGASASRGRCATYFRRWASDRPLEPSERLLRLAAPCGMVAAEVRIRSCTGLRAR